MGLGNQFLGLRFPTAGDDEPGLDIGMAAEQRAEFGDQVVDAFVMPLDGCDRENNKAVRGNVPFLAQCLVRTGPKVIGINEVGQGCPGILVAGVVAGLLEMPGSQVLQVGNPVLKLERLFGSMRQNRPRGYVSALRALAAPARRPAGPGRGAGRRFLAPTV